MHKCISCYTHKMIISDDALVNKLTIINDIDCTQKYKQCTSKTTKVLIE